MTRRLAIIFSALVVCACALALSVFAQSETRYTVLLTGKTAGVQTSNLRPDGAREFTFEYTDRGRGPKLTTTIRLDAAGRPGSLDTKGTDYPNTKGNHYLKAPVAETFTFEQGVARWKNTAESGEKRLASNAFYNSMN